MQQIQRELNLPRSVVASNGRDLAEVSVATVVGLRPVKEGMVGNVKPFRAELKAVLFVEVERLE